VFLGYSDSTNFMNFLWLNGIPSYYGGSVMTQLAMQQQMDDYTIKYMKHALFDDGEFEIIQSKAFNEIGLDWGDESNLQKHRYYEPNQGWFWSGECDVQGISWGGCLESIDEILRHGNAIPALEQFENVILMIETCEEISSATFVFRVFRALGERGILGRIKALLVGRAKAWEFDKPFSEGERNAHRQKQMETIVECVRMFGKAAPIVQNIDFGHTDPQIAFPYGATVRVLSSSKQIFAKF
jgi:muramoyltetrapeptide carboxypeptidase LdcA involved in peptidoglycan recycling